MSKKKRKATNKDEIVIYKSPQGEIQLDVRFEKDTLWLTHQQIGSLFQRDRSVVTRHLNNIFNSGELSRKSNVQKMHIPNSDRPVKFYNLDVILSVGYRVNSKRGTQFRIWANKVLKEYLVKGYALNEKRLKELYPSIEEKAAILLYLTIKNHSFIDGNKRIAAALFLMYLDKNRYLYRSNGEKRLADNALVALCLMIAESNPREMDTIVKVVINLINRNN
jgi:prophage maintenance system killer protein